MKDTKIPLWPLYTADSLMLLTVIAIAYPNIVQMTPMGAGQTMLCCIFVIAGMAFAIAPYWFEHKQDLAKKTEHTDEAKKNFEIIFDELATLRLMIAEQEERAESTNETICELKAKTSDTTTANKLAAYESGIVEFKESIKKKFKEVADSIDTLSKNVDEKVSSKDKIEKETKETLGTIGADIIVMKDLISATSESGTEEISKLRQDIEELLNEKIDELNARMDEIEAATDNDDDHSDEGVYDASDDNDDEAEEEDDEEDEDDFLDDEESTAATPKLGGMLSKALNGAEATKASVDKFVSRGKQENIEESEVVYDSDETVQDDFIPDEEPKEEEFKPEQEEAEEASEKDKDDDFFEPADSEEQPESADKNDDEKIVEEKSAETVPEPEEKPLSNEAPVVEDKKEEKIAEETLLFESLPESNSKPQKAKKSDTVIVVNALIGIGNRPYLRGDNAGLSMDKGEAMEFVEIGKWRKVFESLEVPLNFQIWKNDITLPNGDQSFTISSGEKKEINLFFPIE